VPITSIRLKNFKCFGDTGSLPVSPLTIIFGRNNAGKSTLLQSLLVLRQTLDATEYDSRLNLRGPLFVAGTYADLVYQHSTKLPISISLRVSPPKASPGEVTLEYSSDEPRPPKLAKLRVSIDGYQSLEIRRGPGAGGPMELHIGGKRIGREGSANFSFPVHGLFPLIGGEPPKPGRPNEARAALRARVRDLLAYLEKRLAGLRAMGAFRHPPQRRYEFGGYLANVIDSDGRTVVDALIDDATGRSRRRGRLLLEVNSWLRQVGRVQILPIRRLSKSARLFELRLRDTSTGRWANFADVGSGIGQAFPVIVEGLRTSPRELFLVQEPEIHLHPDAQLAMGDFLYQLAASGRRVIAETHSEAMLLRIRRRAIEAGSSGDLSHEDISILVVDHDETGMSVVRPIQLDEIGQVSDWPKGFMEEVTRERVELMKVMASNEEQTEKT
jgi:predicted ATPase